MYHVCPNTITKGIDVIPMQAMCILAAMKLFRSGFPRHWFYINSTIMVRNIWFFSPPVPSKREKNILVLLSLYIF